ncbi:MAG TPA: hypothetical protein VII38_11190 [Polyangia bacterium]
MGPSRAQKRWSSRLRTAGALLLLVGVVALVDLALPGRAGPLVTVPAVSQLAIAAAILAVGGALFVLGRRWR